MALVLCLTGTFCKKCIHVLAHIYIYLWLVYPNMYMYIKMWNLKSFLFIFWPFFFVFSNNWTAINYLNVWITVIDVLQYSYILIYEMKYSLYWCVRIITTYCTYALINSFYSCFLRGSLYLIMYIEVFYANTMDY